MDFNKMRMTKTIRIIALMLIILFSSQILYAKKIDKLEFYDQPISDILLALAGIAGVSIVPDETVYGKASFVFVDIEFEEGLRIFLRTYNMYLKIENGIYFVSKIRVEYNPALDIITAIDAEDVNLNILLSSISKAINKTILKESLPTMTLSVHQKNIQVNELLEIIIAQIPQYKLETYTSYYRIQLEPTATPDPDLAKKTPDPNARFFTRGEGGRYSIQEEKKRFKELVEELFRIQGAEYQFLIQRDVLIDSRIRFENRSFEEMLRLLCEQGSADFKVVNGVYYVFEIAQRDILKKLKETIIIPLKFLTAQDIMRLFPPDLGSSKFYRVDTNTNIVILNGSIDEIIPIAEFIQIIDKPMIGTQFYRYDLKFIKSSSFQSYLPDDYKFLKIVQIPDANAVLLPLSPERKKFLDQYVDLMDRPISSTEIQLKYIKAEDLMKNLPPSVSKDDIALTQNPSTVFLKGPPDKQRAFKQELAIFDKPVPQIIYHIFAISYSDKEIFNWQQTENPNITVSDSETVSTVITGTIGNLLSSNFDIPSILGLNFAVNLSASLKTNKTEVLTDTALYGLSGEKVLLNDTDVFRYAVTTTDTTTGEKTTGPTQSYETGFILTINGWVSGDGMISMAVEVEISDQKSSADVTTGDLGTTSKKSINTKTRTASGNPIKIGGLIRENTSSDIDKIPILGDIPVLGIIFQRKADTTTRSEIVVYILPHIVMSSEEKADTGMRLNNLYIKYLQNRKKEGS